jgi:hypothetical protein
MPGTLPPTLCLQLFNSSSSRNVNSLSIRCLGDGR